MTLDAIRRMYAHMYWGDDRVLSLMHGVEAARTREPVRLFSHVLAAERVWMLRLRGEDSSVQPIWPDLAAEDLDALAVANRTDYACYLDELGESDLKLKITYTNSRGTAFHTEVADVLLHVALHGSYHRGQIAAAIRAAGADPVNTDYITYARENR